MAQRSRNWCFTYNNWDEDLERSREFLKKLSNAKYIIYGKEVGEKKKTKHLQGYVEFKDAKSFDSLKKKDSKVHWEARRGTQEEAIKYCKKEGHYREYGKKTENKPGARNDIKRAKEMIDEGAGMEEIINEIDSYQAVRMAELKLKYSKKKRNWKPEVTWIWGETGTGKTRLAFEMCKDPWISGKDLRWWNGYDGEEDVIFDEFRGDSCKFSELLRILDRYPYTVEVKGGFRQLLARKIVITSCYAPDKVYKKNEEDIKQLMRRIDKVICTSTGVPGNTIRDRATDEDNGCHKEHESLSALYREG